MPTLSGPARRVGRYLADNSLGALALVVALSGTAYAAATIGSDEIIDDSVASVDIKNGTVSNADILDNTVGRAEVTWASWRKVKPFSASSACDYGAVGELCGAGQNEFFEDSHWENYGGAYYQVARFRKDATGEVTLDGMVKAVNYDPNYWGTNWSTFIYVLPAGFRPSKTLIFAVVAGTSGQDTIGSVEIDPEGHLLYRGRLAEAEVFVSLTGISFPTG